MNIAEEAKMGERKKLIYGRNEKPNKKLEKEI